MTQFNDIVSEDMKQVTINGKTSYMPRLAYLNFSNNDAIQEDEQEFIIEHGKTTLITTLSNKASYVSDFTLHLNFKNFIGEWYGKEGVTTPNIIFSTKLSLTELGKVVDLASISYTTEGNNTIMSVIIQPLVEETQITTFMCEIYLSTNVLNIELKSCLTNLSGLPNE